MVQRNECRFGKRINIDLAHCLPSNRMLPILSETSASQQNYLAVGAAGAADAGFASGSSLYYSWPLLLSHKCGTMNTCERPWTFQILSIGA
jgi:hypothetical protein